MSSHTYSVYLVQHPGSQGGERQVTSPVSGSALDFYESGVWLTREEGKNFFPYEQIRTIREHPGGDSETESSDSGEHGDDSVRDEGAEEDMLE
ncbi:hypothetical protein [Halorussus amylolyticus]|uniref:hypothetical protein n=1 Tax=Halorussus amylolyticus TaxID=1126242 RepID=UPI00192FB075|nr:hypothetical protein [Halorussus amylolyticus]